MDKKAWLWLLIIIFIAWLPLGDPFDLVVFSFIARFGIPSYLLILIILLVLINKYAKGKTLVDKIKNILKK